MPLEKNILYQPVRIVDLSHRADSISTVMRTDQQRLRLIIGNTADSKLPVHIVDILVKLGSKRSVLDIVNRPLKPARFVVNCHSGTSRPQMGMIIRPKKQIKHTILFGCNSKKTAHFCLTPPALYVDLGTDAQKLTVLLQQRTDHLFQKCVHLFP